MELVKKEENINVKRNIEFYNLDAIIAVGYLRKQQNLEM